MALILLKIFHACLCINFREGHTTENEKQETTQLITNIVRTKKSAETVWSEEYAAGYTAGYMQALDDLVAWLKGELD
jgi:hypothetical protein